MKLILLFPALLVAQDVRITYSPQGAEILMALTGKKIPSTQVVSVTVCPAVMGVKMTLDFNQIFQDASRNGWDPRDPDLVPVLVQRTVNRNRTKIAVDLGRIGIGIALSLVAGGPVAASKEWIAGVAMGSNAAQAVGAFLRDRLPDSGPLMGHLLKGQLSISPGECIRGLMVARYPSPKNAAMHSEIRMPGLVAVAGPGLTSFDADGVRTFKVFPTPAAPVVASSDCLSQYSPEYCSTVRLPFVQLARAD